MPIQKCLIFFLKKAKQNTEEMRIISKGEEDRNHLSSGKASVIPVVQAELEAKHRLPLEQASKHCDEVFVLFPVSY